MNITVIQHTKVEKHQFEESEKKIIKKYVLTRERSFFNFFHEKTVYIKSSGLFAVRIACDFIKIR